MPTRSRSRSTSPPASQVRQLALFDAQPHALVPSASVRARSIDLSNSLLAYALKRGRRRTIGFTIDDAGLTVTAPRWVPVVQIEQAIREKSRWIVAKLAEWHERRAHMPRLTWAAGAELPWLGATVSIALDAQIKTALIDDGRLVLPLADDADAEKIRHCVHAFMQARAKLLFAERLALICERADMPVGRWALSSARTRWGSCTSDGAIRLHWRLLHFPLSVVDYVIAHEVAHRRELNHGPRFWRVVESIDPHFRAAEELLKFHSPGMMERS